MAASGWSAEATRGEAASEGWRRGGEKKKKKAERGCRPALKLKKLKKRKKKKVKPRGGDFSLFFASAQSCLQFNLLLPLLAAAGCEPSGLVAVVDHYAPRRHSRPPLFIDAVLMRDALLRGSCYDYFLMPSCQLHSLALFFCSFFFSHSDEGGWRGPIGLSFCFHIIVSTCACQIPAGAVGWVHLPSTSRMMKCQACN